MGKQAQTIELSTKLGINYIPCCGIVLMCYNVWLYVFGFALHTHTDLKRYSQLAKLTYTTCYMLGGEISRNLIK
jgi:hypothetical protein